MSKSNRPKWMLALTGLVVFLATSNVWAQSRSRSRRPSSSGRQYHRAPSSGRQYHRAPSSGRQYYRPPSSGRHYTPSRYRHTSRHVQYRPTYVHRTYSRPVITRRYPTPQYYAPTRTYSSPYYSSQYYAPTYTYSSPYYSPPRPVIVRRRSSYGLHGCVTLGSGLGFTITLCR